MFRFASFCLVFCLTLTGGAFADDVAGSKDHPILSRYPESGIKWYDVQGFMPYKLAVGPVTGYRNIDDWVETQGRVTRIYYELVGEHTHGDVYANYKKALEDAGFEILADGFHAQISVTPDIGSRNWLGVFYAANELPSSAGIELLAGSATAGGSAFIAGKKQRDADIAYVAITVTQQRADRVLYMIDVIEVEDVKTDLVTINAEAIGKDIAEFGRVVLDGLYFDHDKATLTAESKPALDEIAKFLSSKPELSFYVVGHTDSVGTFDYNAKLSADRAAAVVEALVTDHGVARERLEPHGVGPLSPVFTNSSDGGRDKNRRVELVER